MTIATLPKGLGFFTRLLDQAEPSERYRLALAQIIHAERHGFDCAWIAQHHFHEDEGACRRRSSSWLRWPLRRPGSASGRGS